MRQFRVGDKVRWYSTDNRPLWNFDHIRGKGSNGHWEVGIVDMRSANHTFRVAGWLWPQPDDPRARYGEPGYLELVEAAPESRPFIVETLSGNVSIRDRDTEIEALVKKLFEACRAELEALCKKLNEGTQ
jgi:hypothetical protein